MLIIQNYSHNKSWYNKNNKYEMRSEGILEYKNREQTMCSIQLFVHWNIGLLQTSWMLCLTSYYLACSGNW